MTRQTETRSHALIGVCLALTLAAAIWALVDLHARDALAPGGMNPVRGVVGLWGMMTEQPAQK